MSMRQHTKRKMSVFLLIWLGQAISFIGSGLTSFALIIWVFEKTGSVLQFALTIFCITIPTILVSPLLGTFADLYDRRLLMLLCDIGGALISLILVLLLATHNLTIWQIFVCMVITSTFNAARTPAYMASVTLLVPKEQFGRVSGLIEIGNATPSFVSPLLGAALLGIINLQGVILLDVISFLISIATLCLVRFPALEHVPADQATQKSFVHEVISGWLYMKQYAGLIALATLFVAITFALGIMQALLGPMLLDFTSTVIMGLVCSIASCGVLVGGFIMSTSGGPKIRIYGVLVANGLMGLCLMLAGVSRSVPLITFSFFMFMLCLPIINGCSQVILRSKVPPHLQGRVFSTQSAISLVALPVALLVAGPLAQNVFEPLLSRGGTLSGTIGQFIGVGPGRGIGLMFMLVGILPILATIWGYLNPRLRYIENEIPDALVQPEPASAIAST